MRSSAQRPTGIVFVVSGPSGSGKGTVLRPIRAAGGLGLGYSISMTTRQPREGEVPGKDYHYVGQPEFLAMIERRQFLEYTHYAGHYYGTPRGPVDEARRRGQDILLEVEVRGAGLVRAQIPDAVLVLLIAPDRAELLRRLSDRQTEEEGDLALRIAAYESELSGWSLYDHIIVNDTASEATEDLIAIIRSERLACRRLDVRGYLEQHFGEGAERP
jgi:guanylate kinase